MIANSYIKYCFGIVAIASLLAACTKLADSYKDFTGNGEIYYPGKADSLKIYPGRNRVLLTWLLTSDPKITKTTLYWNNKSDSTVIPVQRSAGVDTIKKMLSPIPEGTYTFEVYTYDSKGNRSVSVSKIANVYGTNYNITLVNRTLKNFTMIRPASDTAILDFYPGSPQHIGVDVRYKNALGDSAFVFVPQKPDTVRVNLLKFQKGNQFIYRTLYKPEINAIDTFYAEFESRLIP
jgi:hypothetical protein